MTISANVGRQFTIAELVALAYKRAGLMTYAGTPNTAEMSYGRDQLQLIVNDLEGYGVMTRGVTFELVSLVSGTSEYDLDASILDVLNPAKYIAADEDVDAPSSESRVEVVGYATWQEITARNIDSDPVWLFVDKSTDTYVAKLWPIPNEAGTLRLMVQRKFADCDADSATVDLPAYWQKFLVCQCAADLAESATLETEKVLRLKADAKEALIRARAKANTGLGQQIVVEHSR